MDDTLMRLRILSVILLIFVAPVPLFSQWSAEIGGTYNVQSGSFLAPCMCTFADGNGNGYNFAVSYDFLSFAGFAMGIKPGVEFQYFKSMEVMPSTLERIADGHQEEVGLGYLSIGPYIRYTISLMSFFVEVGSNFQYIVSSRFNPIGEEPGFDPTTPVPMRLQRYSAAISAGYRFHLLLLGIAPMVTADYPHFPHL